MANRDVSLKVLTCVKLLEFKLDISLCSVLPWCYFVSNGLKLRVAVFEVIRVQLISSIVGEEVFISKVSSSARDLLLCVALMKTRPSQTGRRPSSKLVVLFFYFLFFSKRLTYNQPISQQININTSSFSYSRSTHLYVLQHLSVVSSVTSRCPKVHIGLLGHSFASHRVSS